MTLGLLQAVGVGFVTVAAMLGIAVIAVLASAIRIVKEYERGVIFRLGRVLGGPRGRASSSSSHLSTAWRR